MSQPAPISHAESAKPDPLKGLVLPAMPKALNVIREERAKADPDLDRITKAIAGDVSLSAEVLRVVNSPAFGLRRPISSIPSAILLLGLGNVVNVVSAVALKAAMSSLGTLKLDHFWDSANDVALVAARVANEYTGFSADTAYTLGLFHDCGVPLLMARHGDYNLRLRNNVGRGTGVIDAEQQLFGMNHAKLGYHVSRAWHLPEQIVLAIDRHHDRAELISPSGNVSDDTRRLVSVLKIAETASDRFRAGAFDRIQDDTEWDDVRGPVCEQLAISDVELEDLIDSLIDLLRNR